LFVRVSYNDPAPTGVYTLSLHDALPIFGFRVAGKIASRSVDVGASVAAGEVIATLDDTDFRHALASAQAQERAAEAAARRAAAEDRKSTRLNSSHVKISYAVFCLKKKKT